MSKRRKKPSRSHRPLSNAKQDALMAELGQTGWMNQIVALPIIVHGMGQAGTLRDNLRELESDGLPLWPEPRTLIEGHLYESYRQFACAERKGSEPSSYDELVDWLASLGLIRELAGGRFRFVEPIVDIADSPKVSTEGLRFLQEQQRTLSLDVAANEVLSKLAVLPENNWTGSRAEFNELCPDKTIEADELLPVLVELMGHYGAVDCSGTIDGDRIQIEWTGWADG